MPSYFCKHPTCNAMLPARGYCPRHGAEAAVEEASRQRAYDSSKRDRRSIDFYHSTAWLAFRENVLFEHPICQHCRKQVSTDVHHVKPIAQFWELRFDRANVEALCGKCH